MWEVCAIKVMIYTIIVLFQWKKGCTNRQLFAYILAGNVNASMHAYAYALLL